MSETETNENSSIETTSDKRDLEMLWDRELPDLREGVETSWFTVSPSNEEMKGFYGVIVRHVPLTDEEAGKIGLPKRETPYKATYIFTDAKTNKKEHLEQYIALVTDNSSNIQRDRAAQNFYGTMSNHAFPPASQVEHIKVRRTNSDEFSPATQTPSDILIATTAAHPDKEIAIIPQHGSVSNIIPGQKDRVVGSNADRSSNFDYTYHLVNAIGLDDYSAVIDMGCSSPDYLPSEKILESVTPYIASRSKVLGTVQSLGDQLSVDECVVLQNGETKIYNWAGLNKQRRLQISRRITNRLSDKLHTMRNTITDNN